LFFPVNAIPLFRMLLHDLVICADGVTAECIPQGHPMGIYRAPFRRANARSTASWLPATVRLALRPNEEVPVGLRAMENCDISVSTPFWNDEQNGDRGSK
jgi:hypothetical protein